MNNYKPINALIITLLLFTSCNHNNFNAIINNDSYLYNQPAYSKNPYQKIMMNTKVIAFNNQNTDKQEFIAIHDPLFFKKRKFVPAKDIFIDYKFNNQKTFINRMNYNLYRHQLLNSDIDACLKSRVVNPNNQIYTNIAAFYKPDYYYLNELPNINDYTERTTLKDYIDYKFYQLLFTDKKVDVVIINNEELIRSIIYYQSSFTNGVNPGITREFFDHKMGIPQEYAPDISFIRYNDDNVQYRLMNFGYLNFIFDNGILTSIEIGYPKTMCRINCALLSTHFLSQFKVYHAA